MEKDLISIIVPVYQVVKYIGKCIDSILTQSYRNIELLLIDDKSTDGSAAVCDIYHRMDKRVRVFHLPSNKGLSEARNKGIEEARGKYLAFVDGDDWIHEDYLSFLYKALVDSECKVSQCESEVVFDGINIDLETAFEQKAHVYEYQSYFKFLYPLLDRDCVTVWNKLYDIDLFQNIRFPNGKIHEDEYITYRLICEAGTVAVIYSKLYYYRRRQESITGTFSPNRIDAHYAFCERELFFKERKEEELLRQIEEIHYRWISDIMPQFKEYQLTEFVKILEECQEELLLNLNDKEINLNERKIIYLFPFSKIQKGSRVVLYGAGEVGIQFFTQIIKSSYCQLVGWFDKNAVTLKRKGYPVRELCELGQLGTQWDYVVIAIADEKIAFDVTEYLKREFGVLNHKIIRSIEIIKK